MWKRRRSKLLFAEVEEETVYESEVEEVAVMEVLAPWEEGETVPRMVNMPVTPVPWGRRRRSTLVNSFSTDQLKSPPLLRNSPSLCMAMPPPQTRIPTPTEVKGRARALRYVAVASDKKENAPQKPTRLMGPISPAKSSQNQPNQGLSKSRTMGVFSSITSSFSRSNLHMSHSTNRQSSSSSFAGSRLDLSKSRSSVHLRSTAPATTEVSNITAAAAPSTHSHSHSRSSSINIMFTEEEKVKLIHDAQPSAYWCGRLSSLYNQYSNEMLEAIETDPENLQMYTAPTPVGFVPPRLAKDKDKHKSKEAQAKANNDPQDPLDSERLASSMFMAEASDERYRRAFATLRAYCVTAEAKKSLWDFQQTYARNQRNERFLPAGGHMTDAWYTRLTKGHRDDKSERGTSLGMGRRTGLSISRFGRSRNELTRSIAQR
ncbi:hypothetical protein HYFRA_00013179 [Hymenoscyphus fraxineus]|uniref:Uncharacterized protein n=1 Tax=Hymenoscyphus fraxineus TaxID=746836 RepID=A0A9N9LAF4_9HELO|nr:hypothetical protein HYFRA_00013179 [Hymenoscyphus fraxineus]